MKEWEKKQGESSKAYETFCMYRDLGIGRQYTKTAEALKKNVSLINRWARRYEWKKRADAWDKSVMEEARERAIKEQFEILEQQQQIGKMIYTKAAKELEQRDLADAPVRTLIDGITKAFDLRMKAVKEIIGEEKTVADREIIISFAKPKDEEE